MCCTPFNAAVSGSGMPDNANSPFCTDESLAGILCNVTSPCWHPSWIIIVPNIARLQKKNNYFSILPVPRESQYQFLRSLSVYILNTIPLSYLAVDGTQQFMNLLLVPKATCCILVHVDHNFNFNTNRRRRRRHRHPTRGRTGDG